MLCKGDIKRPCYQQAYNHWSTIAITDWLPIQINTTNTICTYPQKLMWINSLCWNLNSKLNRFGQTVPHFHIDWFNTLDVNTTDYLQGKWQSKYRYHERSDNSVLFTFVVVINKESADRAKGQRLYIVSAEMYPFHMNFFSRFKKKKKIRWMDCINVSCQLTKSTWFRNISDILNLMREKSLKERSELKSSMSFCCTLKI